MNKEVLLFSGGLDSVLAYFYLGKPKRLHFEIAHRYHVPEVEAVDSFTQLLPEIFPEQCERSQMLRGLGSYEQPCGTIPFRNLYLYTSAALQGYEDISLVVQKGEDVLPDRSSIFFNQAPPLVEFLNEGKRARLNPVFPFFTKAEMLEWFISEYKELSILQKHSIISLSFSCYFPVHSPSLKGAWWPCGNCAACIRTFIAISWVGLPLGLISWVREPHETEAYQEYVRRAKAGDIDAIRANEILSVEELYN